MIDGDAELTAMRDTSESAMPDTCTIKRLDWPGASLNASTGLYTPAAPTVVYPVAGTRTRDGRCRLRPAADAARSAVPHGDGLATVNRYTLTVPFDAGPVRIGDVAEVTKSTDPHVGTRSFRVVGVPAGSWQIDQRLDVEEVTDRAT